MTEFRCIYRDHVKPKSERSLEHIWPDGLGGDYGPDFFMTKEACGRCNNLLGQFVDAEYQRSFFAGTEEWLAALAFMDTSTPAALPLIYMGNYPAAPNAAEICESWLGPRGERVFFLHARDESQFDVYAGGDPIRRSRKDGGRAYLAFTKPNLFWTLTAMLSVRKGFKKAELRLLTRTDVPELEGACAAETAQSREDRSYVEPLLKQTTAQTRLAVTADHGVRFQCKLALGFGHALFGRSFADLEYAQRLRAGLWERDSAKRCDLQIVGTSLLASVRGDDEAILGYPGAYTFAFTRVSTGTMLTIYSPSTRSIRTAIAPAGHELAERVVRAVQRRLHRGADAGIAETFRTVPAGGLSRASAWGAEDCGTGRTGILAARHRGAGSCGCAV